MLNVDRLIVDGKLEVIFAGSRLVVLDFLISGFLVGKGWLMHAGARDSGSFVELLFGLVLTVLLFL